MENREQIRTAIADHLRRVKQIHDKFDKGRKLNGDDLRFLGLLHHHPAKAGRPANGSQALPVYTSMASCAAGLGIPIFMLKQAKEEGCEAFRFSRIESSKLLPFLFRDRKDQAALDASTGINHNKELTKWKACREKLRYMKDSELMVSREEVSRGTISAIATFYASVDRIFCNELPPSLVGLSEVEIRAKCKGEIGQLKCAMRKSFAELTKPVEAALPAGESERQNEIEESPSSDSSDGTTESEAA